MGLPAGGPCYNFLSSGILDDDFGLLYTTARAVDVCKNLELLWLFNPCAARGAEDANESALSASIAAIDDREPLRGKRERRRRNEAIDVLNVAKRLDMQRRPGRGGAEMRLLKRN